VAVLFKDMFAV